MSQAIISHEAFARIAVPADTAWIRALIPERVLGAYMLLRGSSPLYAGRSDTCLATRLTGHELLPRASHLVWEVCRDPVRAFHCEAFWYDRCRDLPGFLNRVHPARPVGHDRGCPFCTVNVAGLGAALAGWRASSARRARRAAKKSFAGALPFPA
jgi:hypothetical protein